MKVKYSAAICAVVVIISAFFAMGMKEEKRTGAAIETIVLSPGNTAPIAENITVTTYRGVSIGGKCKAVDAENENIVFHVTKNPKHGEVSLSDDGTFLYDPKDTKASKDSFSYVAEDSSGNRSEAAKVTIVIEKKKGEIEYTDMEDDTAEYASVYLSENGIYTGKCVGDDYFFCPDETVSQSEFLSMCLKASGHTSLTDVAKTGLDNDSDLPDWVKNSVSTAVLCGCFTGKSEFEYSGDITYEEAVVMIDAVFDITDVATASAIAPYYRNTSAQAMNNLYFCGIIDESVIPKYDKPVTMRDAAIMLASAMEVYNNR